MAKGPAASQALDFSRKGFRGGLRGLEHMPWVWEPQVWFLASHGPVLRDMPDSWFSASVKDMWVPLWPRFSLLGLDLGPMHMTWSPAGLAPLHSSVVPQVRYPEWVKPVTVSAPTRDVLRLALVQPLAMGMICC